MSEYYLADQKAEERQRRKRGESESAPEHRQAQDIKITLLGDFLFPNQEPQGFDPYNHANGKPVREVWKSRRQR
jgi:hypothetical protein